MESHVKTGLMFAMGTALFWGLYGPTLAKSRVVGEGETPFKVYIFIGLAYLVWGIIGGTVANRQYGGNFTFHPSMIQWGFAAGTLGAFGALCLTFAVFHARLENAGIVMPVVFGGATSVAAITGYVIQYRAGHLKIDPLQILGFVFVVVGIVLIQKYASHGPPKKATAEPTAQAPLEVTADVHTSDS